MVGGDARGVKLLSDKDGDYNTASLYLFEIMSGHQMRVSFEIAFHSRNTSDDYMASFSPFICLNILSSILYHGDLTANKAHCAQRPTLGTLRPWSPS